MGLRGILPYLLLFAAISGYLYLRMGTVTRTPRRPMGDPRWHERGRASRRLRIHRSWDELGSGEGRDREKGRPR
jgi:hypothetical protein